MKRELYGRLLEWKASVRRKPLLLQGARQTGKTWLLLDFGGREYDRVLHCDFERNPGLQSLFEGNLDPSRILADLKAWSGVDIRPEKDLLVFDEIQQCPRAITSLKYFCDQMPEYPVVAAGSLLGVKMSVPGSFPVGKTDFLTLHPLHFGEFLTAVGKDGLRLRLAEADPKESLPGLFHEELVRLLRMYLITGGMPEVVAAHADGAGWEEVRRLQEGILSAYELDFAKHAPTSDIPKLSLAWESLPRHLARENKKFIFSAVRKGARGREYESALRWLKDAGLVNKCWSVEHCGLPLKHYADPNCVKVYPLDVGLLGALSSVPPGMSVENQLFTEYKGALAETYVAQQLAAQGMDPLYYWRSKGGRAELDFVLETEQGAIPLEVKAGVNAQAKSLRSYDQQFAPPVLCRSTLLNLKLDGKVLNVPLYALPFIRGLLEQVLSAMD